MSTDEAELEALTETGHHVTGLVRDESRTVVADDIVVADALDPVAVRGALLKARPDVVVHQLTALRQMSAEAFETTARLRTEGTANLITAAREAGAAKLVVQSISFATAPLGAPVLFDEPPHGLNRNGKVRRPHFEAAQAARAAGGLLARPALLFDLFRTTAMASTLGYFSRRAKPRIID